MAAALVASSLSGGSSSLFLDRVPKLVDGLNDAALDVRIESLEGLALLVDSSTESDLAELCRIVRDRGGCEFLAHLMTEDEPLVHQNAMLVLGNVASERVDASSVATKELLRRCGALELLIPHIWSEVYDTVLYALGALLNLCADVAYVEMLQDAQVPTRLQEIAECGDSHLERFAKGCLHNIREAILQLLALKSLDCTKLQALARGFLARRLARRLRAERDWLAEQAQLEHDKNLLEAAERIQAAARRHRARLVRLLLWRRRAQLNTVSTALSYELLDLVVDEEAEAIAAEAALVEVVIREEMELVAAEALAEVQAERDSEFLGVVTSLLNEVVDAEAAAVAAECLMDASMDTLCDELLDLVVDEEAEAIAAEAAIVEVVIREQSAIVAADVLAGESIVNAVVAEEAARVAAEAIAQLKAERDDQALALATGMLNDIVDQEVAAVAAETLTAHTIVEEVVAEEAAKIAAEALALAAEQSAMRLAASELIADDVLAAVVFEGANRNAAWVLATDEVVDDLIAAVVRSIARPNAAWLLAYRKVSLGQGVLKNFSKPRPSKAKKKMAASPFGDDSPLVLVKPIKKKPMKVSKSTAEMPAEAVNLYSSVPLPALRTSASVPAVVKPVKKEVVKAKPKAELPPVRAPPKPKPPPPPKEYVPKKIEMRQHRPLVFVPAPLERKPLPGMDVDEHGFVIAPKVKPRPMFGLQKSKHATFPDLHILDKTPQHALHLSGAKEIDAAALAREANSIFGLRWEKVGSDPDDCPTYGVELHNEGLADSLGAGKLIFTRKEFQAFGVEKLLSDHYVRKDGIYYRPAGSLRGSMLKGVGRLDAASDESIAIQLNKLLAGTSGRLLDLFREWDLDSDGRVDFDELRQALKLLGYDAPTAQYRRLFLALGGDDDGKLDYWELKKALTHSGASWHSGWCRNTPVSQTDEELTGKKALGKIRKEAHYVDGAHPLKPRPDSEVQLGEGRASRAASKARLVGGMEI